jgi:hypothetical protein
MLSKDLIETMNSFEMSLSENDDLMMKGDASIGISNMHIGTFADGSFIKGPDYATIIESLEPVDIEAFEDMIGKMQREMAPAETEALVVDQSTISTKPQTPRPPVIDISDVVSEVSLVMLESITGQLKTVTASLSHRRADEIAVNASIAVYEVLKKKLQTIAVVEPTEEKPYLLIIENRCSENDLFSDYEEAMKVAEDAIDKGCSVQLQTFGEELIEDL